MITKHPSLILAVLLAATLVAGMFLGVTPLDPARIIAALLGFGAAGDMIVLWEIRLPRLLAAALTGAALGASGAALQGLLRNPLAEPGVLGVSGVAALCATLVLYFGLAIHPLAVPLAAVIGAVLATAGLAAAAMRSNSTVRLLLIGVGVSSFSGAAMALVMNFAPNPFTLSDLVNWLLGSVANRSFAELAFAAPFCIAGGVCLALASRSLSAMTLGEEAAAAIGANVARSRVLVVIGAGLCTGAAVGLAGAVGFVGIVAAHIVRPWVRYDPARTLIPSAILGATMVAAADILARIAPTTNELKLGVILSLIGAPIFIAIAMTRSRSDG